jgi:ribosomal protein S18 acetylase RimI-like enzyme
MLSAKNTWSLRPTRLEDLPALTSVINARYRMFTGEDQVTEAEIRADWENPRSDPKVRMCTLLASDGRVVGRGEVIPPDEPYVQAGGGITVSPDVSADDTTWDLLLRWAEERARAVTAPAEEGLRTHLHLWSLEKDDERQRAYVRHGLTPVRAMHRMRIDFEAAPGSPEWPDGLVLRTFDPERDLGPLCIAIEESFRDHWGRVPTTPEAEEKDTREWMHWQGEAFDPTLSTLAWDGEQVAGYVLGRWHLPLDRSRGVVASLAVRSAWRRRGLGLALLRNTLGEFRRRGCASAELLVDSGNLSGALRLYESAGMRAFRTQIIYEKELRAGVDITTRA